MEMTFHPGQSVTVYTNRDTVWFTGTIDFVCLDGHLIIMDDEEEKQVKINPEFNQVIPN
jgi:hypothetical protein